MALISNGWFISTVAGLCASIATTTVQAVPLIGPTRELKAAKGQMVEWENIAGYRRCWVWHGRRHCRVYQYEYDLRTLPYGKRIWWEQYDRERGGGRRR